MSNPLTPSAFFFSPRAAKSVPVVPEETSSFSPDEAEQCDHCAGQVDGEGECYAEEGCVDGEGYEEDYGEYGVAPNQMILTLSYTLLNQVRQTARAEGVAPEDFILELVAEGITRRAFEDAQRPQPSHLMTRTGYVPPEADAFRNSQQNFFGGNGNGQNGNTRGNNQGNQQRRFNNQGGKYGNNGNASHGQGNQGGNRFGRSGNGQKNRFHRNNKGGNG